MHVNFLSDYILFHCMEVPKFIKSISYQCIYCLVLILHVNINGTMLNILACHCAVCLITSLGWISKSGISEITQPDSRKREAY